MKIKAYTSYSESSNTKYSRHFEVVKQLPEIGSVIWGDGDECPENVKPYHGERQRVKAIEKAWLDCEQGNDEVYDFDFFEVHIQHEEFNEETGVYDVTPEDETLYMAVKIRINHKLTYADVSAEDFENNNYPCPVDREMSVCEDGFNIVDLYHDCHGIVLEEAEGYEDTWTYMGEDGKLHYVVLFSDEPTDEDLYL